MTALACLGEVLVAHVWFNKIMYTVRRQLGNEKICFCEKIAMCVKERKNCVENPKDLLLVCVPMCEFSYVVCENAFWQREQILKLKIENCEFPCVSSAGWFVKMRFGNGNKFEN